MAPEFVTTTLTDLGPAETYSLLTSLIVPRPIAFITTIDDAERANLAPFSFLTVGGSNPPSIVFSATLNKQGRPKNTLKNVMATGEFVVNCVHRKMAEALSLSTGPDEERSEWELCGFIPLPSLCVRPPRVQQSHAQLECRLFNVVEHGGGPDAARYVIGEVLCVHTTRIGSHPISRLGGADYLDLESGEVFQLT
jgi:flavin reductase (DIM6/NTAB) family NADH-FMN oxidoreductase RutF